ncbi:MAG: hypothetical protein A2284_06965 [Deltaproteobacteria bacterium RIFOXYA12_FULL_61_11]|nr:MAG: hypothetical protein A2284_06965 [Deltaproteobacteria bacterium RIFOXYA12_FULL_61_11]
MRIAYVAEWDPYHESGVFTKIQAQVRLWQALGNDVRLFMVSLRQRTDLAAPPPQVHLVGQLSQDLVRGLPSSPFLYLNKVLSASRLARDLLEWAPEIVYYRQGIWYPGLDRALAHCPYVMEINTLDRLECRLFGRVKTAYHLTTRHVLIDRAAGFVCVTHEIARDYQGFGKPVYVLANGYDLSDCQPLPPAMNEHPHLVFVGYPEYPWNGIDRLLKLAQGLPEVEFHLAGYTVQDITIELPRNVHCQGRLDRTALRDLYSRCDLGLGSMALERKGCYEACNLKTREYLALGLPVILGCPDTDLSGKDYVLELQLDDHEPSAQILGKVQAFLKRWKARRVPREQIAHLDTAVKEPQRLEFLRGILEGSAH